MHFLTVSVLLCLATVAFARFQCGNDELQSKFAEALVETNCKGRLNGVNNCCRNHTNCYKRGAKREKCDAAFCKCTTRASKNLPICKLYTDQFCSTAKAFGGIQYDKLKPKKG